MITGFLLCVLAFTSVHGFAYTKVRLPDAGCECATRIHERELLIDEIREQYQGEKKFDGGRPGDDISAIHQMLQLHGCDVSLPLQEVVLNPRDRAIIWHDPQHQILRFCGCVHHPPFRNTFEICYPRSAPISAPINIPVRPKPFRRVSNFLSGTTSHTGSSSENPVLLPKPELHHAHTPPRRPSLKTFRRNRNIQFMSPPSPPRRLYTSTTLKTVN